jgi:formate dehydrogenase major subunit
MFKARQNGEANPRYMPKDESNPYFTYDPAKCIVCSRCVRACEEVQGTFALTIEGRGFESRVSPGMHESFMNSECVSCGACVQACPTATLQEKSVIEIGQPEHSVVTTCAYCGVGCSFKAEMRGEEVVRMVPWKDGKANRGHSCVKGRFAWGYATHKDRILNPMVREKITDPWREVSWEEAFAHVAKEFRRHPVPVWQGRHRRHHLVALHQRGDLPGAEADARRLRQQQCRHLRPRLPFAHRLWPRQDLRHLGRHAGFRFRRAHRRGHRDRRQPDRRPPGLRLAAEEAAARRVPKLIVIDPRRIDLVKSAHIEASHHCPAPRHQCRGAHALAHVIVTEKLFDEAFIRERCDWSEFEDWASLRRRPAHSPEATEMLDRRAGGRAARRGPALCPGGNGAIYYGLGVTEHSQGSTTVMAIANLAMAHRQYRPSRRRREPAPRPEQRAGLLRHGLVPARAARLPPYLRRRSPRDVRKLWGVELNPSRACASPTCSTPPSTAPSRASTSRARTSCSPTPTPSTSPLARGDGMRRRPRPVPQRDRQLRPCVPAGLDLPRKGRHLHQCRAPHQPRAQGDDAEERLCRLGSHPELANAMGLDWHYTHPTQIMDEIAATTPSSRA